MLVVNIVLFFSYLILINWKNNFESSLSIGKYPNSPNNSFATHSNISNESSKKDKSMSHVLSSDNLYTLNLEYERISKKYLY